MPDDTWTGAVPVDETPGSLDDPLAGDLEDPRAVVRIVSDVQPMKVSWLWNNRIPVGMLSEICGDPGEGKSHLTLAIATAVTLGVPLPGEEAAEARLPGNVLLIAPEDSPEVTIRPRLEAMGADLGRVTILEGFRGPDGGETEPLDLSRADHRLELRDLITQLSAHLVIIDPITAHLGGANEWKDSEVRSILAPLARTADQTGAAIVLVRHLRKSDSSKAMYRAGGSIAFTASVRSSLLVGRPEGEEVRRAVVRVKGNLCADPPAVGFILDESGWSWTDAGEWSAADLLKGDTTSEERSAKEEAAEFLLDALRDGPRSAKEIRQAADADGIAWRTVHRARRDLGVTVTREGFPAASTWHPPEQSPQLCQPPMAQLEDQEVGTTGEGQSGEGVSGVQDPQLCQNPLYREDGTTGAETDPEATCADCGTEVEFNPVFVLQRCNRCALKAGAAGP